MVSGKRALLAQLQHFETHNTLSLESDVDQFRTKRQKPRPADGFIHPSMITACPRQMFFHMNKVVYSNWAPNDPGLQRIFDMGHAIEYWWMRTFREMNLLVAYQKPIPENKDRVRGNADAVIWWENQLWVIDVKSANSNSYTTMIPHFHYLVQVSVYMRYLQIPRGKLYYVNKNTSEELTYTFDTTHPAYAESIRLVDLHNYHYDNRILPDVSSIRPKCTNKTCSYYLKCLEYPEKASSYAA